MLFLLQKWRPFPSEWESLLEEDDTAVPDNTEVADQSESPVFFQHPTRGAIQTHMFQHPRFTRLFFNDDTSDWERMPLFWERNMPEVQGLLQTMDEALPYWQNVNEQV